MSTELTREALLAYRNRRWDLLDESKARVRAEHTRVHGPAAGLAAGAALWEHVRRIDPTWPSAEERRADFEHHVALADKLRRVAHVFSSR